MGFHQLTYSDQLRRLRFLTTDILSAYGLEGSSIKLLKYQRHYVCRVISPNQEPLLLRISTSNWDNPAEFEAHWHGRRPSGRTIYRRRSRFGLFKGVWLARSTWMNQW